MTSPTVFLDERYMLRPEYETRNYDLATDSRTMDFPASGIKIAGTAVSATAAELNYLDLTTLGTGAASKAVVLDTGDDYTWPATGILTVQNITGVPAAEFQATDPSQKVTLYDDFLTGTYDATIWADGEGADTTGAIGPVIVANALEGTVISVSGDDNSSTTTDDTSGISTVQKNWTTANGGLVIECRAFVDDITNCSFFIGFTDRVVSDGGTEMPIDASGTADVIDFTAADAAGIIFDTEFATNPTKINLGSVSGSSVTAIVVGAGLPVNATYQTFRVTINAARTVEGFVDGTSIGTIASALADVALCPVVVVRGRTTAIRKMTVDYIWVQQNR